MKATTREQFAKMSETMSTSAWFSERGRLEELIGFSKVAPTDAVLDVGCGLGFAVLAFAEKVAEAVGMDLTEEMVQKAKGFKQNAESEMQNSTLAMRRASPSGMDPSIW